MVNSGLLITSTIFSFLLVIVLGQLLMGLYKKINSVKIDGKIKIFNEYYEISKLFKERSLPVDKLEPIFYKTLPIILLAFIVIISVVLPFEGIQNLSSLNVSILLSVLCLVTGELIISLSTISAQDPNKIHSGKRHISVIVKYYLPIIFSIIGVVLQYIIITNSPNSIPSFNDIIDFQNENSFGFLGLIIPAAFIFLNPFALIGFLSSIIGLLRKTNLGNQKDEPITVWNSLDDFTGRKKGILRLVENSKICSLIIICFALFFGNLSINTNYGIIIELIMIILLGVIIFSFGDKKPRIIMDRGIGLFIRTPLLFSALSIIWSILSSYFMFYPFL